MITNLQIRLISKPCSITDLFGDIYAEFTDNLISVIVDDFYLDNSFYQVEITYAL